MIRSSMKPIRPQGVSQAWPVKPGDDVEIRLRDGRTVRTAVAVVDQRGIVAADSTTYSTSEIVSVKRREFSARKTIGLAIAGFLTILAIGAASYAPWPAPPAGF